MDITLQVVIDAPNHDLSYNNLKEASRYRRGDIVAVYKSIKITEAPSPNSRLGFVHITGIPDGANAGQRYAKIKNLLIGEVENPLLSPIPDPDFPGEYLENREVLRRRAWRIPPSVLPVGVRNKLVADREITVTWLQAKPYVRKKLAINQTDPSQDDETTELSDGDI